MFSMATIISLYCFLSLINNYENRKVLIALVLANFLLIYSHYFAWIVILMQFLVSFMYLDNKKLFRELVISMIINSIVFLSMIPLFINYYLFWSNNNLSLYQPPDFLDYFYQLSGFLNLKYSFVFIALIIVAGIINILLTKKLKKIPSRELIIVFLWWFIPYSIMFLVSIKVPIFRDRYVLFTSVGLYLFIAVTINFLYTQKQVYLLSVFLLILMFTQLNVNSRNINYSKVKNSINNLKRKVNNNSIIIINPSWASPQFMYYFNRDIYKNITNYNELLLKNNIFPVNNLSEAKEKLETSKIKHFIYVQTLNMDNNETLNYLNTNYLRTDSAFYPDCLDIGVYESGKIKPGKNKIRSL